MQTHELDSTNSSTILRISTPDGLGLAMKIQSSDMEQHPMACEQDLRREYVLLNSLRHANVITVGNFVEDLKMEAFEDAEHVCGFTMELASCDLLAYLRTSHPNPLHPEQARGFFSGIARALNFCHSKGITHNDLKLENILIIENESGCTAKLSDFGFARHVSQGWNAEEWEYRTHTFLAPELLHELSSKKADSLNSQEIDDEDSTMPTENEEEEEEGEESDSSVEEEGKKQDQKLNKIQLDMRKCDVFAFGVCLFESLFFVLPFKFGKASIDDPYYSKIASGDLHSFQSIPYIARLINYYMKNFAAEEVRFEALIDLLFRTLSVNPKERPSFDEIINHPWFNNSSNSDCNEEIITE